jgi:hypothetical protein
VALPARNSSLDEWRHWVSQRHQTMSAATAAFPGSGHASRGASSGKPPLLPRPPPIPVAAPSATGPRPCPRHACPPPRHPADARRTSDDGIGDGSRLLEDRTPRGAKTQPTAVTEGWGDANDERWPFSYRLAVS